MLNHERFSASRFTLALVSIEKWSGHDADTFENGYWRPGLRLPFCRASTRRMRSKRFRVGWTIPAEESKYWMMRRPAEFPDLGQDLQYRMDAISRAPRR